MQPTPETHPLVDGPLREPLARVGLLVDFDGTLSDLVAPPDAARLRPDSRAALLRLLRLEVPLAVVSGRTLADLERRCPLPGAWRSGTHGSELSAPDGTLTTRIVSTQDVRAAVQSFLCAARALEPLGVRVEDKRDAAAAHVREIKDPIRRAAVTGELLGLAEGVARTRAVDFLEGKAVVELRPRGTSKRNAVQGLLRRWPPETYPVALGDDAGDEEMFDEALRAGGLAVKVGPGPTAATHRLEDPADVARFLGALAHALEVSRS